LKAAPQKPKFFFFSNPVLGKGNAARPLALKKKALTHRRKGSILFGILGRYRRNFGGRERVRRYGFSVFVGSAIFSRIVEWADIG
jgi:hypothetical protein